MPSGFGEREVLRNSGYSKVIAQRQQLSALILQVIDEPRVLSILLSENLLQRPNTSAMLKGKLQNIG